MYCTSAMSRPNGLTLKFFSGARSTEHTVFAEINAHPGISAHQKQRFFKGGTQNRWLLMSDFSNVEKLMFLNVEKWTLSNVEKWMFSNVEKWLFSNVEKLMFLNVKQLMFSNVAKIDVSKRRKMVVFERRKNWCFWISKNQRTKRRCHRSLIVLFLCFSNLKHLHCYLKHLLFYVWIHWKTTWN